MLQFQLLFMSELRASLSPDTLAQTTSAFTKLVALDTYVVSDQILQVGKASHYGKRQGDAGNVDGDTASPRRDAPEFATNNDGRTYRLAGPRTQSAAGRYFEQRAGGASFFEHEKSALGGSQGHP